MGVGFGSEPNIYNFVLNIFENTLHKKKKAYWFSKEFTKFRRKKNLMPFVVSSEKIATLKQVKDQRMNFV